MPSIFSIYGVFMDIVSIRTFLTIIETRSFAAAAQRLFVTQSTVSSRIRALEEALGSRLFNRGKYGAELTPTGVKVQRHAETMVRAWNQARLEANLPSNSKGSLIIAGPATLWDGVILPGIAKIKKTLPGISIRGELANPSDISSRLIAGTLDLALHYRPETVAGLAVTHLFDDELVLVTTTHDPSDMSSYIYVDWGPAFQAEHAKKWPESLAPDLMLNIGSISLAYLLANPASAYLPKRTIEDALDKKLVMERPMSPRITQPIYGITTSNPGRPAAIALQLLQSG
jgi:DNA-binding transcriptional LysR family regulator